MKYQTCPKCGASLDYGEMCGCDEIKENEPPHANENGSFKRTKTKKSCPAKHRSAHISCTNKTEFYHKTP